MAGRGIGMGIGFLALLTVAFGCSDSSDDSDPGRTALARGLYAMGAMEHAAPPSNDVITAAGEALMDGYGHGVYTFTTSKNQQVEDKETFWIDLSYRIAPTRIDPGAITTDGEFMFRVRKVAGPAIWFYSRNTQGAVTSLLSGNYHFAGYRHANGGPGLVTAFGTANFTGLGTYSISSTLSDTNPENRAGTIQITPQGNTAALEGTELYVGFVDPEGNVSGWLDLDHSSGAYVRMDMFIRQGSGMTQASLNGTYNLGRYFQASLAENPGSGFGTITFDGQGGWSMEYKDHNDVLRADSGTYVMAANGAATVTTQTGTLRAYLSPNPQRRLLYIVDTDVTDGELGVFVATGR
jgi:hypothetical protein